MSDVMRVGSVVGASGGTSPFTASVTGAQRVNGAHGKYLDAVMGNRAYYLSGAALAPTAYVGASGGTPLFGIHNPVGSGKLLSLLMVSIANRVTPTAAGTTSFCVWTGPSVIPTGTQTAPRNALSATQGGSAALGFQNTAMTGSTALLMSHGLGFQYWATAAASATMPGLFDIAGIVLATPGNQIAFGATTALTSATYDCSMFWEELPYLL